MSGKISAECFIPNKSKTYLLPILARELSLKYLEQIENTFLFVKGITEEPILGILYKYTDKIEYTIEGEDGFIYYARLLKESKYFVKEYELGDYSLFVFKLPDTINYAYGCLLEGKYSWITPKDKKSIISFLTRYYPQEKSIITKVIGILNRSDILRENYEKELNIPIPKDAELSSKIDVESETIDPSHVLRGE